MKINNKKIIVSTLALAMGAALAGSISGSVAWYQYSTRTTAVLEGVSAGTSRNLQIQLDDNGWVQDLSAADINAELGIDSTDSSKPDKLTLSPATIRTNATSPNFAKDKALATRSDGGSGTELDFLGQPVYQYGDLPEVDQTEGTGAALRYHYIQLPLSFKVEDNGALVAKDIYLVDAQIVDKRTDTTNYADITNALRIHIENNETSKKDFLIAKTAESTNVSGALDLNNNGVNDRDGFNGLDTNTEDKIINYGNKAASTTSAPASADILKQASWKIEEGTDKLLADDTDAYDFEGGQVLGTTTTDSSAPLQLMVTIWLEGWAELSEHPIVSGTTENETLWSTKYIGSDFGINLRFACEAER